MIGFGKVAPFAGAWIEILRYFHSAKKLVVAPFAGAWIEINILSYFSIFARSHPSRVRGLKYGKSIVDHVIESRTLRGCVD